MSGRLVLTLDEAAGALVKRAPAPARERAGITRVSKRCPLCKGQGYLWLGGKDDVECPDCEGSGTFVLYRQPVAPPGVRIFMPGQTFGGDVVPVELESV